MIDETIIFVEPVVAISDICFRFKVTLITGLLSFSDALKEIFKIFVM